MERYDFKAFFEQSSDLMAVVDTAFNIIAASNAYLNNTATTRENITGQNLFSVFPDNPADITANGVNSIFSSLQWVMHNKTTDSIGVIKYDIPKPASQGGGFIVKYWSLIHSPVFNELNEVKYIVQHVVDVTQRKALAAELAIKKNALKHLVESEKRYNMMLMKSQFAFAVLKGKDKIIVLANDRVKKI
ncbi:hypothetical protein QWZ08_06755 [Ferruginibacter paludis]|uniref:hypothetical protein n=1 Tax=Ferruginibacter paludis TaxID=1310417 RepID=UPI0025B48ECD|nr:hypothetical protein [Ferruginibacter paludis]MDN3655315.1 hypothetical protein [Ferruginibacter paludis]